MTAGHASPEPIDVLTVLSALLDDHPGLALREVGTQDGGGLRLIIGTAAPTASRALRERCAALGIEFREE